MAPGAFTSGIDQSHASPPNSVGEIIGGTHFNQIDIVEAPESILQQLDQQFLDHLETVQVTAEAPWDTKGEKLLHLWMGDAQESAAAHNKTGYKLKTKYRQLSIAVILCAGLVFLFSSLFPCDDAYKGVQVCVSFISLIVANLSAFFDYGPKYQSHFQYDGLYSRYAIDIQELIATQIEYRPPKDKTMVEFRERRGNLVTSAPET